MCTEQVRQIDNKKSQMGKHRAIKNMASLSLLLLVWLFYVMSLGCQTIKHESHLIKSQTAAEQARIKMSVSELRKRLDDLAGFFCGTIEQAADRVIAETSEPQIERRALFWKINAIPVGYRALFQADPAVALIDTWAFSSQMVAYFENGPGKEDFGQFKPIALDASRRFEKKITQLAAQTRTDGNIEPFQEKIRIWVAEHPIQRDFFYRDTAVQVLISNLDKKKLDALQTIGSLALSMEDIAFRLFIYMDLLTKQARWQSELLMSDPHNDAGFQLALKSLDDMVATVDRITPVVERLPDLVAGEKDEVLTALRQERVETLADIDRQRNDTLTYLTRERTAAIDELKSLQYTIAKIIQAERETVLNLIEAQRKAFLTEIESAGNRMVKISLQQSEKVIDHFFIRMAQLSLVILFLGGVIISAVKLTLKRKNKN